MAKKKKQERPGGILVNLDTIMLLANEEFIHFVEDKIEKILPDIPKEPRRIMAIALLNNRFRRPVEVLTEYIDEPYLKPYMKPLLFCRKVEWSRAIEKSSSANIEELLDKKPHRCKICGSTLGKIHPGTWNCWECGSNLWEPING